MTDPPDQIFLAHLDYIERVAAHACRRRRFSREEAEEFISTVKCKLIENDYAIVRKFQGKSSFKTYLTVVVQRLFLDHLNHIWGKWRPSAEAERLGPLAVQLERMHVRDGISFDEACEILRTNHHVKASLQELANLAGRLPRRMPPRQMEGESALENRPDDRSTPDQRILALETEVRHREILGLLTSALSRLPAEDALLVRMSCEFKIAEVARTLHIEQRLLYRRRERILKNLRQDLESRGVRAEEIEGLIGGPEEPEEDSHAAGVGGQPPRPGLPWSGLNLRRMIP